MTLERTLDLFERFVTAHEVLAAALAGHEKIVIPVVDSLPSPTATAPVKELVEEETQGDFERTVNVIAQFENPPDPELEKDPPLAEALESKPPEEDAYIRLLEIKQEPLGLSEKELAERRKADRKWLKDKLDELGVEYTTKQGTAALIKKCEAALGRPDDPAPDPGPAGEAPLPEIKTPEEMRTYLQAFMARHDNGRTVIKQTLNGLDAVNLSALPLDLYPELLAQLAAHENRGA